MRERPRTTRIPAEHPTLDSVETLQISTPVIDIQTIDEQPAPAPRVPSKGVKMPPSMDSTDQHDFAREDEDALVALEQIEKALRGHLPG